MANRMKERYVAEIAPGRAEALSAFNSPSEFCVLQLPNASVL